MLQILCFLVLSQLHRNSNPTQSCHFCKSKMHLRVTQQQIAVVSLSLSLLFQQKCRHWSGIFVQSGDGYMRRLPCVFILYFCILFFCVIKKAMILEVIFEHEDYTAIILSYGKAFRLHSARASLNVVMRTRLYVCMFGCPL